MKSKIVSGLGVAVCFFFVVGVSPASGACADPEWVSAYWPPFLGLTATWTGNWCEGPQCFDKSYGAEMTIVAVDDEGLFPKKWKVRHGGSLTNLSCEPGKPKQNYEVILIPEMLHCVFALQTANHLYLQFLGSIPDTSCLGWAECVVVPE